MLNNFNSVADFKTFDISMGDHTRTDKQPTEQKVTVTKVGDNLSGNVRHHPTWNSATLNGDIALIQVPKRALTLSKQNFHFPFFQSVFFCILSRMSP